MINGTVVDNVTEYSIRGSLPPQCVVDILRNLKYRNVKDEPTLHTRSIEIAVSVDTHSMLIHVPIRALEVANTTPLLTVLSWRERDN